MSKSKSILVAAAASLIVAGVVWAQARQPMLTAANIASCGPEIVQFHAYYANNIRLDIDSRYCPGGSDPNPTFCAGDRKSLAEFEAIEPIGWWLEGEDGCSMSDFPCFGTYAFSNSSPETIQQVANGMTFGGRPMSPLEPMVGRLPPGNDADLPDLRPALQRVQSCVAKQWLALYAEANEPQIATQAPASPAPAPWIEVLTTTGCKVFFYDYDDPQAAWYRPVAWTWTGGCQNGNASGFGDLTAVRQYGPQGQRGTMIDGFFNGRVDSIADGEIEKYSNQNFRMGCGDAAHFVYCEPYAGGMPLANSSTPAASNGSVLSATRSNPAAGTPGGPGGFVSLGLPDTTGATPPGPPIPQTLPSGALPPLASSLPSTQHNPAGEATDCVKLIGKPEFERYGVRSAVSDRGLINTCGRKVTITWCTEGADCNPGYSNLHALQPSGQSGDFWPMLIGAYTSRVHWAGCYNGFIDAVQPEMSKTRQHACK